MELQLTSFSSISGSLTHHAAGTSVDLTLNELCSDIGSLVFRQLPSGGGKRDGERAGEEAGNLERESSFALVGERNKLMIMTC
jgi:hypothetical protein